MSALSREQAKKVTSPTGVNVYYWNTWKPGMREPFAVLHSGSSLNHTSMLSLAQALAAQGTPSILFDQRGTGYSDKPLKKSEHSIEQYTADIERIILAEGIQKPLVIGHSAGGMIALSYGSNHDTTGVVGLCTSARIRNMAANEPTRIAFNSVLRFAGLFSSLVQTGLHKMKGEERTYADFSDMQGRSTYALFTDTSLAQAWGHCMSGQVMHTWDITQGLNAIRSPVLLFYGEKDTLIPPRAGTHIAANRDGLTRSVLLHDADHNLPLTHASEVAKQVRDYFAAPKI